MKNITVLIQTLLSFFIILFGVFSLYIDGFLIGTQVLLAINMFLIAYNNQKQIHDKFFTISYIIMGIMCIAIVFLLVVR